jgi:hypothetical protein
MLELAILFRVPPAELAALDEHELATLVDVLERERPG